VAWAWALEIGGELADSTTPKAQAANIVPDALDGEVIDLEGRELRIITVGQSDTNPSTIAHIPSLAAVISGDVAYNGIHQWLAATDHEKRMGWIASVEQVQALDPQIVVAGHKRPEARDGDPATILGDTKAYIRDFDQSLADSHSAQELVDKMMVLHGDLGNPYTLWTAAQGVFQHGQGACHEHTREATRRSSRSRTTKGRSHPDRRTALLTMQHPEAGPTVAVGGC
jgi:glyoxylase-like metal-dependent hydrolase (beta-lactamase superfamily II)